MTGNELKKRRQALGLSQEKLAREFGLAGSTIARLEQLKDEELPMSQLYERALLHLESEKK